jgi:hypothetical protein
MSFRVVIATERRVCTCVCEHHHAVDESRRCAQFIEPGQQMAEKPDSNWYARRCMNCAELAGMVPSTARVTQS